MTKLHLSADLAVPLRFLELRTVIFGGSGSGKTTAGRVLFEEANRAGVLAGAIDLKSDWWGLKSTADGKGEGIPLVVFGGDHQDVPIDPEGGAALAEIIVDLQQPFVVDLEELSKGKQMRFLAAFFDRLYHKNRKPLVLFCDEADRYAPQRPMSPESNFSLGAVEDIAKRGRKHGVFPVFITQRNASLNKNVSELCDTAIVFRTAGPRDQEAVADWFSTKATREQRDQVMKDLAGLDTGTAVICSAHPTIRLFETASFRMPTTFDSSATPEIGGKRNITPKKLATPDLEAIKLRMAETIRRTEEEDPRKLRQQLATLRRELAHKQSVEVRETVKERTVEVPVLNEKLVARLESSVAGLLAALRVRPAPKPAVAVVRAPVPVIAPRAAPPVYLGERKLSTGQRKILTALAQYPHGKTKRQVGVLTGYAHNGGGFNNYVSALWSSGFITREGENLRITDSGMAELGDFVPLPTGSDLRAYWMGELGQAERCILKVLIEAFPNNLDKNTIAMNTAAHKDDGVPYAANGGGFNNAISRLRTLELVEGSRDSFKANATLFDV